MGMPLLTSDTMKEMKDALRKRSSVREEDLQQVRQMSQGQRKLSEGEREGKRSRPPSSSAEEVDGGGKRSSRQSSSSNEADAGGKRSSRHSTSSTGSDSNRKSRPESSEESVFVESKVHRKGSKVYKNRGWKYSRTESINSTSSAHSCRSIPEVNSKQVHMRNTAAAAAEVTVEKQEVKEQLSPEQLKLYVDQKYEDIFSLLASVGVDVEAL